MKKIDKIVTNQVSRSFKLLKLGAKSGLSLIKSKKGTSKDKIAYVLSQQFESIVNEFGLMKGSVMKAGQMLSLYSQAFLPKELNDLLKDLESKSFYLSWDEISKNIPEKLKNDLDFDPTPLAAASLGQVHLATDKKTYEKYAVKIQYRGVQKAIDNDIRALKLLLKISKLIPNYINLNPIFEEIKKMLKDEVDYELELFNTRKFKELTLNESHYYVPEVFQAFSGKNYICFEYIKGLSIREIKSEYSQSEINQLGETFFELFFKEIFEWNLMQTDAHPGNYILQDKRWVLIDFGSTKIITPQIQEIYRSLIKSTITKDSKSFEEILKKYHYISSDHSIDLKVVDEYLEILGSPYVGGSYNWGDSIITDQVLKIFPKLLREFKVKSPPQDIIFIDRKIGGVFFILKLIGAEFDPTPIIKKYIDL